MHAGNLPGIGGKGQESTGTHLKLMKTLLAANIQIIAYIYIIYEIFATYSHIYTYISYISYVSLRPEPWPHIDLSCQAPVFALRFIFRRSVPQRLLHEKETYLEFTFPTCHRRYIMAAVPAQTCRLTDFSQAPRSSSKTFVSRSFWWSGRPVTQAHLPRPLTSRELELDP